jgi:hypothetical protein
MPQRVQQLTQSKNDATDWKPVDHAHFIISHPKWMKHGIRTGSAIRCLIDATWETFVNTDGESFVLPVSNCTDACRSSSYRSIWKINEKNDGTFLQDRPGISIDQLVLLTLMWLSENSSNSSRWLTLAFVIICLTFSIILRSERTPGCWCWCGCGWVGETSYHNL